MEEHFLKEHVEGAVRRPPEPWYNADGDCIIYQMIDEAVIAERVDEVLTIYNSAISGKSIGYQIKGVGALARRFGWEGIIVASKEDGQELKQVSLTALLMAAYGEGPKTIRRRKAYSEACEFSAPNSRMRTDNLPTLVQAY